MELKPFEPEFNDLPLNTFRQGMLDFFDEERLKRAQKKLKKLIKIHAKPEVFEKLVFCKEFKVSSGDSVYGDSGPIVNMVEKNDFDLKIEFEPMLQTFYYYCKHCGAFSFDDEGGLDDFLENIEVLEMPKPKKIKEMRSREQQRKEAIQTYSEDLFGRLPKPPKYE